MSLNSTLAVDWASRFNTDYCLLSAGYSRLRGIMLHSYRTQRITEIKPNDEIFSKSGTEVTIEETVVFHEKDTPQEYGAIGYTQPLLRPVGSLEADIKSFLARPVKMFSSLAVTYGSANSFDVITNLRANAAFAAKIRNFYGLRGCMKIQLVGSCTQYVYGRVLLYYYGTIGNAVFPRGNTTNFAYNMQYKAIYDWAVNSPVTLCKPYCNTAQFSSTSWGESCTSFVIYGYQGPLDASTNAAASAYLDVYAWLEDAEVVYPTAQSGSGSQKMELAHDGPLSRPASIVSKVAGAMKTVPIIGPFASVVETGAKVGGAIAKAFGFSDQRDLQPPMRMKKQFVGNFANGDGLDSSVGLAFDSKQALTIDPRPLDNTTDGEDRLSLKWIYQFPSYILGLQVSTATATDSLLFTLPVCPGQCYTISGGLYTHTTLSYLSTIFSYWRGSLKYTIQPIASRYHQGTIRVYWTATSAPADTSTNTSLLHVIPMTPGTSVDITVPWGSALPALYCSPKTSSNISWDNGYLQFYMNTHLVAPSAAPVYIDVFVTAGDDFEFIAPHSLNLAAMSPTPYAANTVVGPFNSNTNPYYYLQKKLGAQTPSFQSGDIGESTVIDVDGPMMAVIAGERVDSLRPLCKRFTVTTETIMSDPAAIGSRCLGIPFVPGHKGTVANSVYAYNMSFGTFTLLMFDRWHGSGRIKVMMNPSQEANVIWSVARLTRAQYTIDQNQTYTIPAQVSATHGLAGGGGTLHNFTNADTLEVEVPDYNYLMCRLTSDVFPSNPYNIILPGICLNSAALTEEQLGVIVCHAMGEDFQCVDFMGPPATYFRLDQA